MLGENELEAPLVMLGAIFRHPSYPYLCDSGRAPWRARRCTVRPPHTVRIDQPRHPILRLYAVLLYVLSELDEVKQPSFMSYPVVPWVVSK